MASAAAIAGIAEDDPGSPSTRRLAAEAELLGELVRRNPARLAYPLDREPVAGDRTLFVTLLNTPARMLDGSIRHTHGLRLEYPRFFPAQPLELYLDTPVFHPNVHPETGFVCLWDRHRAAHTAEDAVHKTAAILGWRLFNLEPRHTMQSMAAALSAEARDQLMEALAAQGAAAPLVGVRGASLYSSAAPEAMRRRLS